MRSHHSGALPRKQRPRRQFMLAVAGCLLLETSWCAADEPAPPPRILMLRGEHRSEYTVGQVDPKATAAASTSVIEYHRRPETRPTGSVPRVEPRQATPVHEDQAHSQAQPDFPQFIRLDDAGPMEPSAVIDEIAPVPNPWQAAIHGRLDTAHPAETSAAPAPTMPASDAVAPTSPNGSQASDPGHLKWDARLEVADEVPGSGGAQADVASTSPTQSVPPLDRLSRTTMMKLDSVQAACFGLGILLCLTFQVAIIVVLLRQRHQQPLQMAAALPAYERMNRGRDRTTGVVDFAADTGLWDAAGSNIGHKWQLEEDDVRKQEATIVEEVVSMNVTMAQELSFNPDTTVSTPE